MLRARIVVSALSLFSAALLAAGCGDAPQRVGDGSSAALHGGSHDTAKGIPSTFTGTAVLEGALAEQQGVLMVSVMIVGQRMPLMSTRVDLAKAPAAVDGRRSVPFVLDPSSNMLGAGLPQEAGEFPLQISVRFDSDGFVETDEGDVTVDVPVEPGASGIEVVLGS